MPEAKGIFFTTLQSGEGPVVQVCHLTNIFQFSFYLCTQGQQNNKGLQFGDLIYLTKT